MHHLHHFRHRKYEIRSFLIFGEDKGYRISTYTNEKSQKFLHTKTGSSALCLSSWARLAASANPNKAPTFVDVVLGEALHGTFDRNLLGASVLAELEFARGGVFGQNVPEPQVV